MNSDLVARVLSRDFRAIARLLSLVENSPTEAMPHLRALFPHTGRAASIGITGAPGSGKSTLVDGVAGYYRGNAKQLGIIAVDPTSPYSGGAILGDRIRMQSRSTDPGTFIRSMATRGHLGGLSRATGDAVLVLDAAGFDVILIETVGVGQDEVDIARTADVTIVLLVPGMGDDVQAMKAGIMEIADIFVINKADRPGADRLEAEVNALLSASGRRDGWQPRVVRTVASEGKGIEECAQAIDEFLTFLKGSPSRKDRTIDLQRDRILEIAQSEILQRLLRDRQQIDRLAGMIAERKLDPYSAVEELLVGSSAKMAGKTLDHIGIAVRSLQAALKTYEDALGLKLAGLEDVMEQKTRVGMLPTGGGRLELLEAMSEDSPVAKFIARRGEGLHHICLRVEDIFKEVENLKAAGVRLIDETPRPGANGCLVAFIHPASTGGVLIELSQPGMETMNGHSA